ncbi:hypothetical protein D3C81_1691770 [compost metagenome]
MNKEFRKRLKPMNSLTNLDAVEKIIYLETMEYNEKYGERVTPGFGLLPVKLRLAELFEERYPTPSSVEE